LTNLDIKKIFKNNFGYFKNKSKFQFKKIKQSKNGKVVDVQKENFKN